MVLCVGSFFGAGNLGWQDYKSGRVKVPIPVYILGIYLLILLIDENLSKYKKNHLLKM